jgi:1-acyl-sn-glycerol-3-phosphate acyltransferase
MLGFWTVSLPIAVLLGFPWTYLTKDITFLYRTCMWAAWTGVRIAGVRVQTLGLDKIDPARTYIFMSNHICSSWGRLFICSMPPIASGSRRSTRCMSGRGRTIPTARS